MIATNAQTDNWEQVQAAAKALLPEDVIQFIGTCRQGPEPASQLIAVLHRVQERLGYLGTEQLDAVAQLLGVPAAKVSGVATFYHYFQLQPHGRYMINVCLGTACYVNGADKVATKLREELGIDFGQTTADGLFSLHSAACLGTCGLGPVVMVNEEVHPKMTPDQVPALLDALIEEARGVETPGPTAHASAASGPAAP
jgi:NADH:ubiquinone oxidoreductase subunit E